MTKLYIDASFTDNRDKAGYGAVLIRKHKKTEISGLVKGAKNSTEAEIFAVSQVLEILDTKENIVIYNDNMACVDVINGSKLNRKSPEIDKAISLIRKHKGKIKGRWVKGHSVCEENCRADQLAREKLFTVPTNDFQKFDINVYIGVKKTNTRIGYSYIIEDYFGNYLYSDISNLRNGGLGSMSYLVTKSLGKVFNPNNEKKVTHMNIISNERHVLSLFNEIIRHQRKNYKKMRRSKVEDGLFQMLKNIKIQVDKSLSHKNIKIAMENADFALKSESLQKK